MLHYPAFRGLLVMKKRHIPAAAAFFAAISPSFAQPEPALIRYEDLLRSAIARDARLCSLAVEEGRSAIALERAAIALREPVLSASSGSSTAYFYAAGAGFYASPAASIEFPGGTSAALSVPLGLGSYGDYATPGLSLGLPILRGADEGRAAHAKARATAVASRAAVVARRTAVERGLVSALKAAFSSDAEAQAARGAWAKAKRELERARTVDGVEPGGIAYRRLEREIRSKARALRDAEAGLSGALEELSSIAGPLPLDAPLAALPTPTSQPDLDAALPDPERGIEVRVARENARAASVESAERARRTKIGAKLGASYSTAAGEDESGDAVYAGLGLSAGLSAAYEGLEIGLGAEYNTGAPTLGLSLAWKPAPRGDRELRDKDERLAAVLESARVDEAIRSARKAITKLESERRDLAARAEDAAWELGFAEEQARVYAEWRAKGLVGDDEYEEVLALERECASRVKVAALDRALWGLELRSFVGEAEALGEGR